MGQQAGPNPRNMVITLQNHHRNPHPQRLAGRGGAIVGKGVQRHIHPVVQGKMFFLRQKPVKLDALRIHSAGHETVGQPSADFRVIHGFGLKDQP